MENYFRYIIVCKLSTTSPSGHFIYGGRGRLAAMSMEKVRRGLAAGTQTWSDLLLGLSRLRFTGSAPGAGCVMWSGFLEGVSQMKTSNYFACTCCLQYKVVLITLGIKISNFLQYMSICQTCSETSWFNTAIFCFLFFPFLTLIPSILSLHVS